MSRLVTLLGDPVAHSLSPRIQNAAFRAAGIDGVYLALRTSRDDFPGLLRGLARAGACGNVTLPHKEEAAALVEAPSDAVVATGACNTFWHADGRIQGANTDVEGVRGAVRGLLGEPPAGRRVLLVGAGGAARAVVFALLREGVEALAVHNRTVERARRLVAWADDARVTLHEGSPRGSEWELVVNATSLGLSSSDPQPLELDSQALPGAILDLVYGPAETPWVRRGRALGIPAADGGEMLVQQGAAAFERWWDRPAPLAEMRAELQRSRSG